MTERIHWRMVGVKDGKFTDSQAVLDHAAIGKLDDIQEKFTGQRVDRLNLTLPPVLCSWVCEINGVIAGGIYEEAIAEACLIGVDPRVTASLLRCMVPRLTKGTRERGIRWIRMFIPQQLPWYVRFALWVYRSNNHTLAEKLVKPLAKAGFVNKDETLSHFSLDLRERK